MKTNSLALALALVAVAVGPAWAADTPPEEWPEMDEPSQATARSLSPASRGLSLFAGIPLLAAGAGLAIGVNPAAWANAPTAGTQAMRVAGISLLGGAHGALLAGHASARVGRSFAGGTWNSRIGPLVAGALLLGSGYGVTIGGLTEGALAVPGLSFSLVLSGVAAQAIGAVILVSDTLRTSREIDRRLPPAVALRADPGVRFAGAWVVPRDGGAQVGFALRFR